MLQSCSLAEPCPVQRRYLAKSFRKCPDFVNLDASGCMFHALFAHPKTPALNCCSPPVKVAIVHMAALHVAVGIEVRELLCEESGQPPNYRPTYTCSYVGALNYWKKPWPCLGHQLVWGGVHQKCVNLCCCSCDFLLRPENCNLFRPQGEISSLQSKIASERQFSL